MAPLRATAAAVFEPVKGELTSRPRHGDRREAVVRDKLREDLVPSDVLDCEVARAVRRLKEETFLSSGKEEELN